MFTWHWFAPSKPKKEETDYRQLISNLAQAANTIEILTVKCDSCGAQTTLKGNLVAKTCDFCDSPLIAGKGNTSIIEPASILTFKVTQNEGETIFKSWIQKRWFAPNNLDKYVGQQGELRGIYLPYWAYGSNTVTHYKGQCGTDYQTRVSSTDDAGGSYSRTVTNTSWSPSSGTIKKVFENVLVVATNSLPKKYLRKLEPWDLSALIHFELKYLLDCKAAIYGVEVQPGFKNAQKIMQEEINRSIKRNIGGDHQRIKSQNTNYNDIYFKHILLPIWLMTYRYHNKVYRFMINGSTGKAHGERPYSWIKITLVVLLLIAVIGLIFYLVDAY
jgi:hypothetical protein